MKSYRRVAYYPAPEFYPENRRGHQRSPGVAAYTKFLGVLDAEEWVEDLERRAEEDPNFSIKGHVPAPAPAKTDIKEIPEPKRWYTSIKRDCTDPALCVVRTSKTAGVVCFYSAEFELEPLSEELPLPEACRLAQQLESEIST